MIILLDTITTSTSHPGLCCLPVLAVVSKLTGDLVLSSITLLQGNRQPALFSPRVRQNSLEAEGLVYDLKLDR